MQHENFLDQITGDIYTYDQDNELFISMGDIHWDTAADLQLLLKDKNKKWLKVTAPSWAYQTPTNPLMLYTE